MVDERTRPAGVRARLSSLLAHPSSPVILVTVAGIGVLIGTFLPWVGDGDGARSSYQLFGVLDRLDVTPDGVVAALVRWWPVVPLLVTASVVLSWWGAHRSAATLALVAASYAGGVAWAIGWFADGTGIRAGAGVVLCAAAGVVLLSGGAWMWLRIATGRDVRAPLEGRPADRS